VVDFSLDTAAPDGRGDAKEEVGDAATEKEGMGQGNPMQTWEYGEEGQWGVFGLGERTQCKCVELDSMRGWFIGHKDDVTTAERRR
jgi:hypothetical protein